MKTDFAIETLRLELRLFGLGEGTDGEEWSCENDFFRNEITH